ncbi:hypothetical protein M422DRAFT_260377 [Sphaerobolus stellatus SS14]|uniref:Uncharacterized protein n=1 Tax=Sphaerobolus stellatus (strain SS14) TaxID=990650 RepID=A0A0C9UR23_SPHS4|nr:hypothetical protein M422DRAFT_260377 [Sphaerobolus stellatus SS14]
MFSLPGGDDINEMLDGHPVVRLTDKAADWECFLELFYGSINVTRRVVPRKRPSDRKQYLFENNRKACIFRLEQIFPSTLHASKPDLFEKYVTGRDQLPAIFPKFLNNHDHFFDDFHAAYVNCSRDSAYWGALPEIGTYWNTHYAPLELLLNFQDDDLEDDMFYSCNAKLEEIAQGHREMA